MWTLSALSRDVVRYKRGELGVGWDLGAGARLWPQKLLFLKRGVRRACCVKKLQSDNRIQILSANDLDLKVFGLVHKQHFASNWKILHKCPITKQLLNG